MKLDFSDIVTIGVSLIGFGATFLGIRHQLINAVKMSINDDRKKVYLDIYKLMNKTVIDPNTSILQEYVDELQDLKPHVYLLSSKEVANKYKDYCNHIYRSTEGYKKFCLDIESKLGVYDEWGEEHFEVQKQRYQRDNVLSRGEYKRILDDILDIMRKDIGIKD